MKPLLYLGICLVVVIVLFTVALFAMYPLKYKDHITEASELYNVDKVLIASVINAESSFKPNAVSNKGAIGLMQVMPSTGEWVAKKMSVEWGDEILYDPRTNILIGTYYLNYLLNKFNDVTTALIAYNAGEGKVAVWLSENDTTTLTSCPYPVTNRYVKKVMNGLDFYKVRL